jgi:hypothetical protein
MALGKDSQPAHLPNSPAGASTPQPHRPTKPASVSAQYLNPYPYISTPPSSALTLLPPAPPHCPPPPLSGAAPLSSPSFPCSASRSG